MKKRYIIPIFIPHWGCPKDCVFCNQRKITGKHDTITREMVEKTIEEYLATIPIRAGREIEIAYYGGSFTGIPLEEQQELLAPAKAALDQGKIMGIRLSTRPDYINPEILLHLKASGVTTIELGVQSLNDQVLLKSNRGHLAEDTYQAVGLIKSEKFILGLQLMVGLPGDTAEGFLETIEKVIDLRPDFVRIYPTLIIKDTILAKMFQKGEYLPLSLEEAIEMCKKAYQKLMDKGIAVIRLGLQSSEEINERGQIIAGPYHPAFRELVEASLIRDKLKEMIQGEGEAGGELVISAHPTQISQVIGQKRSNIEFLKNEYKFEKITVLGDKKVEKGQINVKFRKNNLFNHL